MKQKTYYDFLKGISSDELYDRLIEYGLFSEKLPPVFSAASFLDYCKTKGTQGFDDKGRQYVAYESMRNTNVFRPICVPAPEGYEKLCESLKENWDRLKDYFKNKTQDHGHIVSRIHIRKMSTTKSLFEMKYKNWRTDGSPEIDLAMGARYVVKADISKCFSSIYSHAIAWALVGKKEAKATRKNDDAWYNRIDRNVRNLKNGETHGLLIGPHTSNIISEIILCAVDFELCNRGWKYIRNIDDYTCFVSDLKDADSFVLELTRELREFGLSLNHTKTQILEFPIGIVDEWVREVRSKITLLEVRGKTLDYIDVQTFLDSCVSLMVDNNGNSSVLLYGVKALRGMRLSENARRYCDKLIVSLSLTYPYLVPQLNDLVFSAKDMDASFANECINRIYKTYFHRDCYEALAYALFYAIRRKVPVDEFDVESVISKKDCILLVMAFIYCKKMGRTDDLKKLKGAAEDFQRGGEEEEYWLFVYECLGESEVHKEWVEMKKGKVSFLRSEYR